MSVERRVVRRAKMSQFREACALAEQAFSTDLQKLVAPRTESGGG
jgi:hypothetical protein